MVSVGTPTEIETIVSVGWNVSQDLSTSLIIHKRFFLDCGSHNGSLPCPLNLHHFMFPLHFRMCLRKQNFRADSLPWKNNSDLEARLVHAALHSFHQDTSFSSRG